MLRLTFLALVASAGLCFSAGVAFAAPPSPSNPAGRQLGVVRPHGQAKASSSTGTSNLSYHSGPVINANTTYAIFWQGSTSPGVSFSPTYQPLISRFFSDTAAATQLRATDNVYFANTQYYGPTGQAIANTSTYGGSLVDQAPFPANGCTDSYTSICLSDAQIRTEIQRVIATNPAWQGGSASPAGSTPLYFVFTPKGVASCSGTSCAFSSFCAYHSWMGSGASAVLYANQPYTQTVPSACGTAQSPNGDPAADSTINVVSHEHNEAITDAQGSAWYDRQGSENGDKCAWTFGTVLGGTSPGLYNQRLNNNPYYLQREWSNRSSGCVQQGL